MAAETIIVDQYDGTDTTFTEVVPVIPGTREFRDLGQNPQTTRLFRFSVSEPADRSKGVQRRRIYVGRTIANAASGRLNTGSVTFEMVIPLDGGDFTSLVMATLCSYLSDFLAGGTQFANSQAFANGAVLTGDFSD